MKIRRTTLPFVLLALAACGETTAIDNIASITLSPPNPSIDVGLSVQFQAQARNANGGIVSGVTFRWASSDTSVAKVDQNGVASAFKIGTTAITASAGSADPGSAVLLVQASQCVNRVDVILSPGQHQLYNGDTCLFLPTGSVGDRYRIAVTRPKLIEDPADVPNVWLTINPILSAAQSPAPAVPAPMASTAPPARVGAGPSLDGTRFVEDRAVLERTRRFHAELREREMALGLRTAPIPRRTAPAGAPARVDPPARDDLFLVLECSASATKSPVKLIDFNADIAIYQDSVENLTTPLSTVATGLMLDYYANHVRDLVTQYWGPTPDIDANERVIITTSSALPDSAAAGVFSGDFRSTADCASSNEGEVVYFDTEIIQNMDDPDPSYLALSIMAHEVKHVTSLFHSVARGAFHSIWIEEGTAEVSQTMSSRVAWASIGGPAIGARIDGNQIIDAVNDNGGEVPPELWGVISELADVIVSMATQPNSLITNPNGAGQFHTFYASSWHFHRLIGDAFGGASNPYADGPLFVELTDSLTAAGTGALLQVTGRTFDQLFEDVVVAMSFHQTAQTPARSFTTWDLETATAIFASPAEVAPPHRYPWPVTTNLAGNPSRSYQAGVYSCPPRIVNGSYQLPGANDRCAIGPSGVRFHEFVSGGSGAGAQVLVSGAASGKLIVTRLN